MGYSDVLALWNRPDGFMLLDSRSLPKLNNDAKAVWGLDFPEDMVVQQVREDRAHGVLWGAQFWLKPGRPDIPAVGGVSVEKPIRVNSENRRQFALFLRRKAVFGTILFLGPGARFRDVGTCDPYSISQILLRMHRRRLPVPVGHGQVQSSPAAGRFWAEVILSHAPERNGLNFWLEQRRLGVRILKREWGQWRFKGHGETWSETRPV